MDRNEVFLVGKLSGRPEHKVMPSGDTLTSWRLVTRRRDPRPGAVVDTIRCVTFDSGLAARLESLNPGDRLSVAGSIRCRIFGPADTKVWRVEVEAHTLIPLSEPAVLTSPPPASPDLPEAPISDLTQAVPDTFLRTADTSAGSGEAKGGEGVAGASRNKGVSWIVAHSPGAATPVAPAQPDHPDDGHSQPRHPQPGEDEQKAPALERPPPEGRRESGPAPAPSENTGSAPISAAHPEPSTGTASAQDPLKGPQPGRSYALADRSSPGAEARPRVPPPRSPYSAIAEPGVADSPSSMPTGLEDETSASRLLGSVGP
ncbi:single-stranded DNA-binding protein [Nonomuraea longicatena]|uniref:Single-stranded DNA-binding protein n=1 Tax=Nonomuraea longicatena TaxID=83682 RepID=A0ABP3ZEA1_9ACTN